MWFRVHPKHRTPHIYDWGSSVWCVSECCNTPSLFFRSFFGASAVLLPFSPVWNILFLVSRRPGLLLQFSFLCFWPNARCQQFLRCRSVFCCCFFHCWSWWWALAWRLCCTSWTIIKFLDLSFSILSRSCPYAVLAAPSLGGFTEAATSDTATLLVNWRSQDVLAMLPAKSMLSLGLSFVGSRTKMTGWFWLWLFLLVQFVSRVRPWCLWYLGLKLQHCSFYFPMICMSARPVFFMLHQRRGHDFLNFFCCCCCDWTIGFLCFDMRLHFCLNSVFLVAVIVVV